MTTCAEQHLLEQKRPQKPWILQETPELVETKCKAFVEWQSDEATPIDTILDEFMTTTGQK